MEQETPCLERVMRTSCSIFSMLLLTLATIGCRSTTLPGISPDPSPLEQVVAAMNREEWEEADRLLTPILPPLSEEEGDDGERSVALHNR